MRDGSEKKRINERERKRELTNLDERGGGGEWSRGEVKPFHHETPNFSTQLKRPKLSYPCTPILTCPPTQPNPIKFTQPNSLPSMIIF
jgi:hypothetical protein